VAARLRNVMESADSGIPFLEKHYYEYQIKQNEMGGTCSTQRRKQIVTTMFSLSYKPRELSRAVSVHNAISVQPMLQK
jgi:hypothetical protein